MQLIELQPEWEHDNTYLTFRCPACPRNLTERGDCWIMIPTKETPDGPKPWGWNGETDFEKVTLTPSIWHHCDSDPHFFITNGVIQFA